MVVPSDSDSAGVDSDLVIVASGDVTKEGNFRKITQMRSTA